MPPKKLRTLLVANVVLVLLISATLVMTITQAISISQIDVFAIPANNSKIGFSPQVNYTNANLENNTWFFTGLSSSGYAGYPIRGDLHFSAKNCTVLINYLQGWHQTESYSSVEMKWISYTVIGAGTQTLDANDLFPNSNKWTQWTVKINGAIEQMGDGWNYSDDSKQLTLTTSLPSSLVEISVYHVPIGSDLAPLPAPEPPQNNFTSTNYFQNSFINETINFAVDGSFDKANFENNIWNFINLTLDDYSINAGVFASNVTGRNVLPYIIQAGYLANLGISIQNCNITITRINPVTWYSYNPEIQYTVQGNGSQVFHFPFRVAAFNWTVYLDGVPKLSNDGWTLQDDYQLNITGASSNVSIFGQLKPEGPPSVKESPLLQFGILTITIGVVLSLISVLEVQRRKRASSSNNCLSLTWCSALTVELESFVWLKTTKSFSEGSQ